MSALRFLLLAFALGCGSSGGGTMNTDGGPDGAAASCVGVAACNGALMCGGHCCNPGESCVSGTCTCGPHAACTGGDQCASVGPTPESGCGSICCGVSTICPR